MGYHHKGLAAVAGEQAANRLHHAHFQCPEALAARRRELGIHDPVVVRGAGGRCRACDDIGGLALPVAEALFPEGGILKPLDGLKARVLQRGGGPLGPAQRAGDEDAASREQAGEGLERGRVGDVAVDVERPVPAAVETGHGRVAHPPEGRGLGHSPVLMSRPRRRATA